MGIIAENKKALFNYEVLDQFDAGISLYGFEVKAVKSGKVNLKGSYVTVKNEELFLKNALIPPYQEKNTPSWYDPKRERKLLLTKKEIKYLIGKTKEKGLTLVPICIYTKGRLVKLKIALVKSKKKFEKREEIKKREFQRMKSRLLRKKF